MKNIGADNTKSDALIEEILELERKGVDEAYSLMQIDIG